jgi:hypothetical protein
MASYAENEQQVARAAACALRDRLVVFTGDAGSDSPASKSLLLTVMDWHPVGEDELVGCVELADVVALADVTAPSPPPFWINLYAACQPAVAASAAARVAKPRPWSISNAAPVAGDERLQAARALCALCPREAVPAIFLSLPAVELVFSCGPAEVGPSARRVLWAASKARGAVEWNDVVESGRFTLPTDAGQMPDVLLYLCYTSGATGKSDGGIDAESKK